MFLLSSNKYLGVELLGHTVVLFLIFWGISMLFSIVAAPISILTNSAQRFPFLCILTNNCYLLALIITILTGVGWYLIVVLICICLMVSNVEHLFLCLICHLFVFFEKMSIQSLCPFFIWVVFLILSCMSSLYTLDINPLLDISFENIICLFILLIVFFAVQKFFKFDGVPFVSLAWGNISKKN